MNGAKKIDSAKCYTALLWGANGKVTGLPGCSRACTALPPGKEFIYVLHPAPTFSFCSSH